VFVGQQSKKYHGQWGENGREEERLKIEQVGTRELDQADVAYSNYRSLYVLGLYYPNQWCRETTIIDCPRDEPFRGSLWHFSYPLTTLLISSLPLLSDLFSRTSTHPVR